MIHRIARIYPLYIVLTFILIAYRVSGSIGIDLCDSPSVSIVSNILLIQNWGICDSYIGPGWSVSTEFAAYLLFPLLLHKLLKRTLLSAFSVFLACLAGLAALCIFLTALAGLGMHGPLDIYGPQRIWPLVRCILGFTLGLAAWRLWDNVQLREKFASPAASWLCAGSLIAILEIPNLDVAFAALAAVFILCLATGNNAVTQFCGSKPVHFMGDISYALYLLHLPLMKLLREEPRLAAYLGQAPAHILALAVYAGVLLSFSILAHRFVEVPCRNKIRQLERGLGVSTTRSDPTPPRPIATDTRQIPKGEPEYPPQRAR